MGEMTPSTTLSDGMRPEAAKRRIEVFRKRFGEAHLYLAYHAAFPLALTPDLLYRLRANFQRDIHGKNLNIPWIAVADLLLSSLCSEVGYELYEVDVAVRTELLNRLKAHPDFGPLRISDLSNFLLKYVRQQLNSHDRDIRDFAQTQYWTALAATRPNEAAQGIALTLSRLAPSDRAEFARLGSLMETFAELSTEFTQLLTYARGMEYFARGDEEIAKIELSKVAGGGQSAQVLGVSLPIPTRLHEGAKKERGQIPAPQRNFFISYHNADRAWAEWIAWQLEEASYSVMLQAWDFQPSADFTREIDAITQIAERLIIVLSPDYLSAFSTMLRSISAFAEDPRSRDEQHTLIAVQVRECFSGLEEMLGPIAYTDLVGLDELKAREALLADVRHDLGTEMVIVSGFSTGLQRSVSEHPQFPGVPTPKAEVFPIILPHVSGMKFAVSQKENFSSTTVSIIIQYGADTIFHIELPGEQDTIAGWDISFTYLRRTQPQELNELLSAIPQLLEIQVDEDAHPTYLTMLLALFEWTEKEEHELQEQNSTENDIPNLYDLCQQLKHALFNFEVITSANNEYYEAIFPYPGQEKLPVHIPSTRFDKAPVQMSQVVLRKAHEREPKCIEYFISHYSYFQEYVISADPLTISVFTGLSKALVKLIKQENANLGIYISLVPDICTFIVKNELDSEEQKEYLEPILRGFETVEQKLERLNGIITEIKNEISLKGQAPNANRAKLNRELKDRLYWIQEGLKEFRKRKRWL